MNKQDQISFVSHKAGVIRSETEKAMKAVGDMIKTALSGPDGRPVLGNKIKLDGIGTWEVKVSPAKTGTLPQYLSAQKAQEAGTADEKQLQFLKAVAAGEAKSEYVKEAGLKVTFKPEAALAQWAGGSDEEADPADTAEVEPTTGEALAELSVSGGNGEAPVDPQSQVEQPTA